MAPLKYILNRWFEKRATSSNPQHVLSRHIYILPSALGWIYTLVIMTIASGAINYQLNAAYFFIFLLIVIGFLAMLYSHQNLKNLTIQCLELTDVSQGESAQIILVVQPKGETKFAIYASVNSNNAAFSETIIASGQKLILPIETIQRGQFKVPKITLYSYYPLGLFKVWTHLYFDLSYYVYPQAISPEFWPDKLSIDYQKESAFKVAGESEQYDLQSVDSPWVQSSRIAWKISARDSNWYLKKMQNPSSDIWHFDIKDIKTNDIEKKLHCLSFWIQTAEQYNQPYSLKLDDLFISPGLGSNHMQLSLRQLALY